MPGSLPAHRPLSMDGLCARYDNEDIHTRHLASLAVALFDATHRWLGAPATDRRLVEAAARLHDVGYSVDPRHHSERSAEIVLRDGLRGFHPSQRAYVAAAMLFHSGKWKLRLTHPLVSHLPDRQRVLRLAAFVRIADGLDSGHLQDARILAVRRVDRTIEVHVHSPWFPANITRAHQKADLWRAVFPLDIRFVPVSGRQADQPALLPPGIPTLEAARRLMWLQVKTILANLDGAVQAASADPLHDVRVAIRRLRSLLRVFRRHLPRDTLQPIQRDLKKLNRALGPARDLDVWLEFLQSDRVQSALAGNRLWPPFLQHQMRVRRLEQPAVKRHLRSARLVSTRVRLGRLLRTELPVRLQRGPAAPAERLAAKHMRRALDRALKRGKLRHADSPAKLHKLRILLRKVRYLGEFFGPLLGRPLGKLTKRIHQAEQALGRIHDTEMAMQHLHRSGPTAPRLLRLMLQRRREAERKQLLTAWRRLDEKKLLTAARARLKRLAKTARPTAPRPFRTS
jgi:CHAD domain-containing protein